MAGLVPQWLQGVLLNPGPGHAGLVVVQLAAAGSVTPDMLGQGGLELTSAAFLHGEELDPSFTADEEDAVAPPLEWTAPPAGSAELVLVVEDPDAAGGKPFCHWLVWGLAAQRGKLLEGEAPPRVGKNAHGNSEWLLPAPPQGDDPHDFVFQLFALDLPLGLMPGASREDLVAAMTGHVTAVALLTGTYARADGDEDWENWEAGDED
jgi:Raf kinase inhibitor-like YbhB/YbcL family protein